MLFFHTNLRAIQDLLEDLKLLIAISEKVFSQSPEYNEVADCYNLYNLNEMLNTWLDLLVWLSSLAAPTLQESYSKW